MSSYIFQKSEIVFSIIFKFFKLYTYEKTNEIEEYFCLNYCI